MGTSIPDRETLGVGPVMGLRALAPQGGPLQLRYPCIISTVTCGYGTSPFHISAPPASLSVASTVSP